MSLWAQVGLFSRVSSPTRVIKLLKHWTAIGFSSIQITLCRLEGSYPCPYLKLSSVDFKFVEAKNPTLDIYFFFSLTLMVQ